MQLSKIHKVVHKIRPIAGEGLLVNEVVVLLVGMKNL